MVSHYVEEYDDELLLFFYIAIPYLGEQNIISTVYCFSY